MCCQNHKCGSFDLIRRWSRAVNVTWLHPAYSTECSTFSCAVNGCCECRTTCVSVTDFVDANAVFPLVSSVFRGEPQTSESGSVPSICRHHAFVMWRRFHGRREVLKERGLDELSAHPSWTIVTQSMWSLKCHLPRMKKHHIFCIYTHFLGNLLAHPGNRYIVC